MLNKLSPYILAVSLFILGLSLGFFAGKTFNTSTLSGFPVQNPDQQVEKTSNELFSSQTATLRGEILKVSGQTLTVKNLNNQAKGDLQASSRVIIAKAGARNNTASPSANLSTLELNKEVLMTLELINGNYQVISIQYTLPAPSLPPVAKPPTAPKSSSQP